MADPAAEIYPEHSPPRFPESGVKSIGRLELQATLVGTGKHDAIIRGLRGFSRGAYPDGRSPNRL